MINKKITSILLMLAFAAPLFSQALSEQNKTQDNLYKFKPYAWQNDPVFKNLNIPNPQNTRERTPSEKLSVWERKTNSEIKLFIKNNFETYKNELRNLVKNDPMSNYAFLGSERAVTKYYQMQDHLVDIVNSSANAQIIDDSFDYSQLIPQDTDFVLLGERHFNKTYQVIPEIIKNSSKKGRLMHFATEFLTSELQNGVDDFIRTKDISHIKYGINGSHHVDNENKIVLPAAKGHKIIALDDVRIKYAGIYTEKPLPQGKFTRQIRALDKERAEFANSPFGIIGRNIFWMKRLEPYMQAEQNKFTIIYCGLGHSIRNNPYPSMVDRLEAAGKKTVVITYIASDIKTKLGRQTIEDRSIDSTPNKRILIKLTQEEKRRIGTDYIIVYPIEKEKTGIAALPVYHL